MPQRLFGSFPACVDACFETHVPDGPRPAKGWPVLVALHGKGDDGARLAERLAGLDGAPYARVYPTAPIPCEVLTEKPPRIGASWYPYVGDQAAFAAALRTAERLLLAAVDAAGRAHGLDLERAALLGYSQGGYLAGVVALRHRARFRGLVGVACRIKTEALAAELPAARGYPILLVHGARDHATPVDRQREAHEELLRHGVASELTVHEGGHGLRAEIVPVVDAFVRRVLGAS